MQHRLRVGADIELPHRVGDVELEVAAGLHVARMPGRAGRREVEEVDHADLLAPAACALEIDVVERARRMVELQALYRQEGTAWPDGCCNSASASRATGATASGTVVTLRSSLVAPVDARGCDPGASWGSALMATRLSAVMFRRSAERARSGVRTDWSGPRPGLKTA